MFKIIKNNKVDLFQEVLLLNQKSNNRLEKIISNLNNCSAKDLNYLSVCLLEKMGYYCEIIDKKSCKEISIIAFKGKFKKFAVQCVNTNILYDNKRVGIKDIQAFKGKFLSDNYKRGIFITTGYFSQVALKEYDDNLILIDRKTLIFLLTKYFPESISNTCYYNSLCILDSCPYCKKGKLLECYSKKRKVRKRYYWCEHCNKKIYPPKRELPH